MMTKTSALEVAPYAIRVNCICPGATRTAMIPATKLKDLPEQIPLNRIGEPEDVAELAFFLASDRARQITGAFLSWTEELPQEGRGSRSQEKFNSDQIEEVHHVDSDASGRIQVEYGTGRDRESPGGS